MITFTNRASWRLAVAPGDCICYLPGDPEAHAFENTGNEDLVIWAFGNRFRHEVWVYPDQGVCLDLRHQDQRDKAGCR
jgi:uncharacterized cupin superfamily protein